VALFVSDMMLLYNSHSTRRVSLPSTTSFKRQEGFRVVVFHAPVSCAVIWTFDVLNCCGFLILRLRTVIYGLK
jgi:hypothetical protein